MIPPNFIHIFLSVFQIRLTYAIASGYPMDASGRRLRYTEGNE
jgi:hypothetical protein